VIARKPKRAERTCLVLIDGAQQDIEQLLASRRKLPLLCAPAAPLKRPPGPARRPQGCPGHAADLH
jgi:hypothetical protein